jgi:hypothetical protein
MPLTFTVRSDESRAAGTALAVTLVMLPQYAICLDRVAWNASLAFSLNPLRDCVKCRKANVEQLEALPLNRPENKPGRLQGQVTHDPAKAQFIIPYV